MGCILDMEAPIWAKRVQNLKFAITEFVKSMGLAFYVEDKAMWENCVLNAARGAEPEDVVGVTHNSRLQLGAPIVAEEKEIVHEMKDDFDPGLCFALITISQLHNCMMWMTFTHRTLYSMNDLRNLQLFFQTPMDLMSFVCKQSTYGTEMVGVDGFADVLQKLAKEITAADEEEKKRPWNLAMFYTATQVEAHTSTTERLLYTMDPQVLAKRIRGPISLKKVRLLMAFHLKLSPLLKNPTSKLLVPK